MRYRLSAYENGKTLGLKRAAEHFKLDVTKLIKFEERLNRVINEHQGQEEASDRFVSLIVELCVLAESARMEFGEPSLTDAQLHWFLKAAWEFFNSWKHK